jgi:hypothetical protein
VGQTFTDPNTGLGIKALVRGLTGDP